MRTVSSVAELLGPGDNLVIEADVMDWPQDLLDIGDVFTGEADPANLDEVTTAPADSLSALLGAEPSPHSSVDLDSPPEAVNLTTADFEDVQKVVEALMGMSAGCMESEVASSQLVGSLDTTMKQEDTPSAAEHAVPIMKQEDTPSAAEHAVPIITQEETPFVSIIKEELTPTEVKKEPTEVGPAATAEHGVTSVGSATEEPAPPNTKASPSLTTAEHEAASVSTAPVTDAAAQEAATPRRPRSAAARAAERVEERKRRETWETLEAHPPCQASKRARTSAKSQKSKKASPQIRRVVGKDRPAKQASAGGLPPWASRLNSYGDVSVARLPGTSAAKSQKSQKIRPKAANPQATVTKLTKPGPHVSWPPHLNITLKQPSAPNPSALDLTAALPTKPPALPPQERDRSLLHKMMIYNPILAVTRGYAYLVKSRGLQSWKAACLLDKDGNHPLIEIVKDCLAKVNDEDPFLVHGV